MSTAFAAAGFLLAACLAAVTRRIASRNGWVVPARADRWHRQPTPTLGGVAIAVPTLVLGGWAATAGLQTPAGLTVLAILAASAVMFVMGLIDDRFPLAPLTKLAAALVVGAFLLFALAAVAGAALTWWQTVVLVIAYAGLVHAFNLLDNMDGLAAGVTVIATVAVLMLFGPHTGPAGLGLLAVFGGSVAGFLLWNVRPARLFMGDCGSLFIGSVLGGLTLGLLVRPGSRFVADGVMLGLVFVVPLLDTSFVLVVRRLAGLPASRGGTDHLSHRLVSVGLRESRAVLALWTLGAAGGATAWVFSRDESYGVPGAVLFGLGVLFLAVYLARIPAYDGEDFRLLQKWTFAPFLRDVAFRWHALEMLLDVVLVSVVFYLAYRLRFGGEQFDVFVPSFMASLPGVLGCKLVALYASGVYTRLWGSFGWRDALVIARGVAIGSAGSILLASYVYRFERFSRGVFIIDAALLTLALLTTRGALQVLAQRVSDRGPVARRVLIYGAGSAGQLLVREMRANAGWNATPVAFLDDDGLKRRRTLMGIPIRGGADVIDRVLVSDRVDEVVLSTTAIDTDRERRVRDTCALRNVPVKRFHLEITE